MTKYIWGVNSAVSVTSELLNGVKRRYGFPDFWGRYLTSVEGTSEGLTKEEISLLKNNGIKIMPIYNEFEEAVGSRNGRIVAQNTIFHAKRLGIKRGVVLFANLERFLMVDSAWLIGYLEAMCSSDYRPGFYNNPTKGGFNEAYSKAITNYELVKKRAILWSSEPEVMISTKINAPRFNPKQPSCRGTVWAWQYGRDANAFPINTVLSDINLYELMH